MAGPEPSRPGGRRGKDVDRSYRATVVQNLRAVRETQGRLSETLVRDAAAALGVSRGHMWKLVNDPEMGTRQRTAYVADTTALRAVAGHGNAVNAYPALKAAGFTLSKRTLQRGLERADPVLVAGARSGYQAASDEKMWLPKDVSRRMQVVCSDHKQIPNLVLPNGRWKKPVFPWITFVMCYVTRLVLSATVDWLTPNLESSLAAFAESCLGWHDPEGNFYGGRCEVYLTDNGGDHLPQAICERIALTGVIREYTGSYSSRQNAVVEAFNGTFEEEFCSQEAGYHADFKDELKRSRFGRQHADQAQTGESLVVGIARWIDHYNLERVHSSLGMTPAQAFLADPTPLVLADETTLHHFLLNSAHGTHIMSGMGIRHRDVDYVAAELHDQVGRKFIVRYLPNTFHKIWVFDTDGRFVCVAEPGNSLTPEARNKIRVSTTRQTIQVMANEFAGREIRANRARERERGIAEATAMASAVIADADEPPTVIDTTTGEVVGPDTAPVRQVGLDASPAGTRPATSKRTTDVDNELFERLMQKVAAKNGTATTTTPEEAR